MMIVTSSQPKLFVIPNDRDFQRILADPITFHTHYILEPDPYRAAVSCPEISCIPALWAARKRVHQDGAPVPGQRAVPEFRLFKVLHHSNQAA